MYIRRMIRLLTVAIVMVLTPLSANAADKMTQETFGSGGRTRTYYLLVPAAATTPKCQRY